MGMGQNPVPPMTLKSPFKGGNLPKRYPIGFDPQPHLSPSKTIFFTSPSSAPTGCGKRGTGGFFSGVSRLGSLERRFLRGRLMFYGSNRCTGGLLVFLLVYFFYFSLFLFFAGGFDYLFGCNGRIGMKGGMGGVSTVWVGAGEFLDKTWSFDWMRAWKFRSSFVSCVKRFVGTLSDCVLMELSVFENLKFSQIYTYEFWYNGFQRLVACFQLIVRLNTKHVFCRDEKNVFRGLVLKWRQGKLHRKRLGRDLEK